jgi:predicted nucleic acid-binding protein
VRIVLDTNVVVSAAFFGGPPRRLIDAWIGGRVQLTLTPLIFDEYLRVCQRLAATYADADYQPLLTAFLAHAHGRLVAAADPVSAPGIAFCLVPPDLRIHRAEDFGHIAAAEGLVQSGHELCATHH